MLGRSVATDIDTGKKLLQWATTGGPADAAGNLKDWAIKTAKYEAQTIVDAGKAAKEMAPELLKGAAHNGATHSPQLIGDAAKVSKLGKFARAIPLVGGVFSVGSLALETPAGATAEEQGMSGPRLLLRDFKAGKINAGQYAAISGLHAAYGVSGFFGFLGLGAQEAAQATLTGLNPQAMRRYFPGSLADMAISAVESAQREEKTDGALGKADEGMAIAATETKQSAQKAAQPMVAHSVKLGAVKTEDTANSGLLGSFSIAKMDVFKGDFNPFS
jgi:hypothetical protein